MVLYMKSFIKFMKTPKGIVVAVLVLFAVLFFAFSKRNGSDDKLAQKSKLLVDVGMLLEYEHYSPKKIDDNFSKRVFDKYLDELDGDKTLFFQSDIDSLKQYQTTIDDEIHGSPIKFVPAVSAVYDRRIDEVIALYKEILSKPFNYTVDEYSLKNGDSLNYCISESERKERWRLKLKQASLSVYSDLLDEKEKNKKDTSVQKPDSVLERTAREKVLAASNRLYNRIKKKFDFDERFSMFVNDITNLMDPHTDYFAPVDKRSFDEVMSGKFFGIGAQLQEQQDGTVKIASVMPGLPAWKSGEIAAGDIILKVAQGALPPVDISGYDITDAVKLIRGEKGSEVRLTIKKQDGIIKVVKMIRDEVMMDEVIAKSVIIKNGNSKIGYIDLPEFYTDFGGTGGNKCSADFAKEIEKLKAQNVQGIVLDLRSNGGGSLYEVVQMVGMLVGKGPVVQVRDKDGKSTVLNARNTDAIYDGPFAVMVNEGSASASEIFAAAIQDYKRGIIIGSTSTYGKGTVQRPVPMGKILDYSTGESENGSVKITFQKFYRINGQSTQRKGVSSDIVIPDYFEYNTSGSSREKFHPTALPWDEINRCNYQTWQGFNGFDDIIKRENDSIQDNADFKSFSTNTKWLYDQKDVPVNLNIVKYRAAQKQLREVSDRGSKFLKLKKDMDVIVTDEDKVKFLNSPVKTRADAYADWLKRLKTDIYINESVKVVSEIAVAQNIRMVNK